MKIKVLYKVQYNHWIHMQFALSTSEWVNMSLFKTFRNSNDLKENKDRFLINDGISDVML